MRCLRLIRSTRPRQTIQSQLSALSITRSVRTFTTIPEPVTVSDSHSQPTNPSSSQPSSTSRIIDVMLGLALGVTLYQSAQWLLEWPEPMPTLQSLIHDDSLIREHIGNPPKLSWFWTGTIVPQSNFSVAVPVRGDKGKGTVYARGVYDSKSRSWKLVYFQCSIDPLLQKHSLDIPKGMDVAVESAKDDAEVKPRSPLVMPANFDPTLLNKEQYVKYQEFLFKHGLKEWKPDTDIHPSQSTDSEAVSQPSPIVKDIAVLDSTADSPSTNSSG